MANISKVKLPTGTTYTLADSEFRNMMIQGAGFANSVFRGKNLGSTLDSYWSTISSGTFSGMFVGDTITASSGRTWRIAHFDYYLNQGDTYCTTHHVVVVPTRNLYTAQMRNTESGAYVAGTEANSIEGAYALSDMKTTNLARALEMAVADFGESHILTHRQYLHNSVSSGRPSSAGWYDSNIDLMTEENVYGTKILGISGDGSNLFMYNTLDKVQFAVFRIRPDLINENKSYYWLRDVISDVRFAYVSSDGTANFHLSTNLGGVRPAILLCA